MHKPSQILESVGNTGKSKANAGLVQTLFLAFLAGAYISFGAMLMVTVVAGLPENLGTLSKFIGGALFPVGLIMIVIGGGDLFTGNCLYNTVAVAQRKMTGSQLVRNWVLSFSGNFFGAIFVVVFMGFATGFLATEPWVNWLRDIAVTKTNLTFSEAFWRGVGCNWLVCLACWLAVASKNVFGKVMGIWFPIMAFVTMGFEHCIANMFFIPSGIIAGAPVSWAQFWLANQLPVTLGNIVGGALFCGIAYHISLRPVKEVTLKEVRANTPLGFAGSTVSEYQR